MGGGARRVAHIVQTVKESYEIEVPFRITLGRRDLETGVCRDPMFPSMGLGVFDRARMEVVANELRIREGPGHQHSGPAVAAPDIGDFGPTLQLIDDAV